MAIKECEINDLDKLAPVFDQYRQRYKQPSAVADIRNYLQQRLENQQAKIYLVLDDAQNINGFVLFYPSFSSIALSKIWVLNDFYVCSGENKKQIAESLIQTGIDLCRDTQAIRLEVTTRKESHHLHRLYKSFGFEKDYKYDYYYLGVNTQNTNQENASKVLK